MDVATQPQLGRFLRWAASAGDFTPLSLACQEGDRCLLLRGPWVRASQAQLPSAVTVPSSELSRGGEGSTEMVPEDIHLELMDATSSGTLRPQL